MAVPALLAVAVAGCSDDTSSNTASTSSAASSTSPVNAAAGQDDAESGAGVHIAPGETRTVLIPADAVMDIKVPAAWGDAVTGLRCTVTDSSGRNEDLRSSDVKKREEIAGTEWVTLWTFSSPPATEVTVGCKDPGNKIAAAEPHYIRVAPRGMNPH